MAPEPGRQSAIRELPRTQGDARGDRVRAPGPGGRALDRGPAFHRHLGLRLRRARLRLLLPSLGEQPGPVAARGASRLPPRVGAAIFAITVASALLVNFGDRRFRNDETLDWQVAGWLAVCGGLLVIGLQIWQLTELPFFPGSSGYASCFIGWAVMNIALVLGGTYWIETILAREIRLRRAMAQDGGAPDFEPACGPPVPGEPQRLHVLLGFHRRRRDALLGNVLRHLAWRLTP